MCENHLRKIFVGLWNRTRKSRMRVSRRIRKLVKGEKAEERNSRVLLKSRECWRGKPDNSNSNKLSVPKWPPRTFFNGVKIGCQLSS